MNKADMPLRIVAVPWQVHKGELQLVLITSRTRGRWILPKGKLDEGVTPSRMAEIECWEEAGVKGKASPKQMAEGVCDDLDGPFFFHAFAVCVDKLKDEWLERHQRERQCLPWKEALALIQPDMADILRPALKALKKQV